MTDTVWLGIIVATPPTLIALTGLVVALRTKRQVGNIETHTNSMVEKIEKAAKKEGKAEVLETLAVASPTLPVTITPVGNQKEIIEWIQQGIALEKARRAVENGEASGKDP